MRSYAKERRRRKERGNQEVERAKREKDVWEIVNRERVRKKGVNKEIGMKEWKEYFINLLGGAEDKRVGAWEMRREGDEEEEIGREEFKGVIKRIKGRKASGKDGIPNEVWKYGGQEVEEWARMMCDRVWRGEGWPEEWKEGWIAPIVKKGEGKTIQEYRGVTMMPTLYRIYAMILAGRLETEIEKKRMIPHNQTGFRKEMGTVDNIYVLNYLINRQVAEKAGKMVALFIDLKAAFDTVDREVLWKDLERRGVRKGIRERVKEIYKETKSRVKVGGEIGEEIWLEKGIRQGCPMSPMLFNILTADLEEELGKGQRAGGVKLDRK